MAIPRMAATKGVAIIAERALGYKVGPGFEGEAPGHLGGKDMTLETK